jgi:autotransporter-associated beta strand protein
MFRTVGTARRGLLGGTLLAVVFNLGRAQAVDGTWLLAPASNDWSVGTNWSSSPVVPDGTATFDASNTTTIANSLPLTIRTMQFDAGAPAYTFNVEHGYVITGLGIVNNSANRPVFNINGNVFTTFTFANQATAGNAIININFGEGLFFRNDSNAGNAIITNNSPLIAPTALVFTDNSTAANATIITNETARTFFEANSSGGQARFITNSGGEFNMSGLATTGMTAGSIEGAGNYVLGSKQLEVGGNNLSTQVSGVISGTGGSLVKVGDATLTLTGNNTYTGPTTVNAGALIVDGSIASSSLTSVSSGATLGGSGTVGPTIINAGGTFAPGSAGAPGAMTVAGNLAFQSGALYVVQVNPTTASSTNVSGTASLAGTVQAAFAAGSSVSRTYTILSAAGGRSGTFGSLTTTGLPAGFTASLSYTDNDAILDLTAVLGGGPNGGLNQNQQNVANALNAFFNNGGTLPPNFLSVFGLTGSALTNALALLSGEAATGAQQGAFKLMDQFLALMLDPFVDGRAGIAGAGGPALGFAPERETLPEDIVLAYAKMTRSPVYKAPPVAFEPRWSIWGGGYGGYNRTDGDPVVVGSHDLSVRTAGFAAGMDYRLAPGTVAGFALAGGGTRWDLAQGLGGGRSDAFQAGVYGATRSGPAYLAASFAFANQWMSTDRAAPFGNRLTADFDAQSFGGRVEGGYRFGTPIGGVTPYAAVQAQSFRTRGYSEVDVTGGGFGLAYSSRTGSDTRSELGARFDHVAAFDRNAVLILRARLAWAHDWVSDPTLAPVFQALPGAGFIVNGALPAKDSALASAGAELRLANGVTLLAKFDGEFASHAQTYAGTGTLRWAW